MSKYLLFPHSGSGNHGCEAIVRTTQAMLEGGNTCLFSDVPEEDRLYLGEDLIAMEKPQQRISRCSVGYGKAFLAYHAAGKKDAFDALSFSPVIAKCDRDTILLSIGGDNYCYGENEYIYTVNRYARRRGTRTVLWGCSVEPDAISEKMAEDLRGYDLIVARESLTYDALVQLNPRTVLCPDPAFTLEKKAGKVPDGMLDKPVIGINVSPLIQGREKLPGITMENYSFLINQILKSTDCHIALIPHVVWDHNDDRKPLQQLYDRYASGGRVFLVRDQNCMQLKDVISRCRFFIGARTHATIAAYSTCVPTLVVGYSVKARGIARDLFGTEEGYVLPVQSLREKEDLWAAFIRLWDCEAVERAHLEKIMPAYIARAKEAGGLLKGGKVELCGRFSLCR